MARETVVEMYMVMASAQFDNTNPWLDQDEREKLAGRICSFCKTTLPPRTARRQTYCEHCPPTRAHRVRMDFRFLERRWRCEFWDADASEMLPARLSFGHADSLYALARRGRGFIGGGSIAKFSFFNAIGNGRGAINLTLDETQYQALRASCRSKTAQASALTDGK